MELVIPEVGKLVTAREIQEETMRALRMRESETSRRTDGYLYRIT